MLFNTLDSGNQEFHWSRSTRHEIIHVVQEGMCTLRSVESAQLVDVDSLQDTAEMYQSQARLQTHWHLPLLLRTLTVRPKPNEWTSPRRDDSVTETKLPLEASDGQSIVFSRDRDN